VKKYLVATPGVCHGKHIRLAIGHHCHMCHEPAIEYVMQGGDVVHSVIGDTTNPGPWGGPGNRDVVVAQRIVQASHLNDEFVRHGMRLAIVMVVATAIAHFLGWPHEYWIPMTVAWVARPGRRLTLERTWHRVLGTIAGIVFVTALMLTSGNSPYELAVLTAAGATMTLIFVRAHYAIAVAGITIAVISLFAIEGQSFELNAPYRIWATLVAGVLLTIGTLVWPSREED
jgi:uncharacterized membrane protein YccC